MRDAIKTSDAKQFVKGYLPLLTAEEEKALFRAWWDSNPKGFKAFMDPKNDKITRFTGGDDNRYLTRILMAYGPTIRRAMKEVANYRVEDEELLSEGLMALSEAARRFKPSEHDNVRFASYAKTCVKGMMQGFGMRHFFYVQFCTNHNKKKLFYSMRKLIAIELQAHGTFKITNDIVQELAEAHNVDETDVMMMFQMFQRPYESLDHPVASSSDGESELSTLGETLEDPDNDAEESAMIGDSITFHKKLVTEAMQVLSHREKTVFVAQILTEKENQRTLDDLGEQFSVSKERIRQVRIEAMRKMTEELHRLAGERRIHTEDLFCD